MTALADIRVTVVDGGPSPAVTALLHEIADLLDRLINDATASAIDLHALPLSPADRVALRERLGAGEVRAVVDAMGESEISETAFAGVWWATHRTGDGQVIAERIEVTLIPDMLKTHPADVQASVQRLRTSLTTSD